MNTFRFGLLFALISPMSSARIPDAGLSLVPLSSVSSVSLENRPVLVNQPSLDLIDEHLSPPTDNNETESKPIVAGPSLDLVDFHPGDHDDDEVDPPEEHRLIQPSFEILDAQLHGGDEHVHEDHKNKTDGEAAANLDDYYRWLKEQNETDQLHRFISLQKEVNRFHLDNSQDLNDKLKPNDRRIEISLEET